MVALSGRLFLSFLLVEEVDDRKNNADGRRDEIHVVGLRRLRSNHFTGMLCDVMKENAGLETFIFHDVP